MASIATLSLSWQRAPIMELVTTPQWIAKMYAAKAGRDHLGLGSVSSDQILPTLSPGINVLTISRVSLVAMGCTIAQLLQS
jgi:hypothetical protein